MIALVNSGGFNENAGNIVAIQNNSTSARLYVQNNYPAWTVVDADSEQECINMVRRGEADCTIFSANRVDHIIQTNHYDGLMSITLSCNTSVSLAVRRDNTHLLHILNQVLDAVPDSTINGALTYYATAPKSITFNDKYGHTEGDCYIRHFVDIVKAHIRSEDIFARIGGDEFCIILRGCMHEIALKKMHEMQMLFSSDHTKEYPKSFSYGIIEVPEDHDAIEVMEILKQADEMMYEQKKAHKKMP